MIAHIPFGQVCTYGQVAAMAGLPRMARAVGRSLQQLPCDSSLPWHRVINAKGELSFPVASEKYQRQRQLLQAEGVYFDGPKIKLAHYRWAGL